MKKKSVFFFVFIAVIVTITACSPGPIATAPQIPEPTAVPFETTAPSASPKPTPDEGGVITIYNYNEETTNIIKKYVDEHPDFPYTINAPIGGLYDGAYQPALDDALASGGDSTPDIYCVDYSIAIRYTQGEMSGYAMPYAALIPDAAAKIALADIAPYIVDVGTRPTDNAVVGLAYQNTAGAFIYRRSIAKDVWGTDDPTVIASKIGPGWDKFFTAAEELKSKGYAIVSGDGDIWHSVENSADKGWVVNGKLYIDPKREAFLDYAKELSDKGFSNGTDDWTDAWFADMAGSGDHPVFGYFGPAWMINFVIARQCIYTDDNGKTVKQHPYGDWAICVPPIKFFWGGTWVLANNDLNNDPEKKAAVAELIEWITLQCDKNSLQYLWASGKALNDSPKDTVASGTVMAMADGTLDFLGGQNMFDVFIPASRHTNGKNTTLFDELINAIWRDQVQMYVNGECTRDEAIAAFKQAVTDQLHIDAWS